MFRKRFDLSLRTEQSTLVKSFCKVWGKTNEVHVVRMCSVLEYTHDTGLYTCIHKKQDIGPELWVPPFTIFSNKDHENIGIVLNWYYTQFLLKKVWL